MKIYIVVEQDYNVILFNSFRQLWGHIQQYRGDDGEFYTDEYPDKVLLTEKLLRKLIKEPEPIDVYTIGKSIYNNDWDVQISTRYEYGEDPLA